MTPVVFLDRDGVVNADIGFLWRREDCVWVPGAPAAIRLFNERGWPVVVITNQSGVARGYYREEDVHILHEWMKTELHRLGARIDAFYFCPHHPKGAIAAYTQECDCRKPRPGMLRRAEAELGADLQRSWVIGDRHGDVQVAWNAGARGALVKTGYGRGEWEDLAPSWPRQPDLVAENVFEAVEAILRRDAA